MQFKKAYFQFFSLQQKISAQHQPCTQFVQPLGVFCQFGKIAMQMRKNFVCNVCRVREKKHKFLHNVAVYAICATVGCFLCQFGKIAMQMRKNFVCNVCRVREKNHKFHTTSAVYAIRATVGCFLCQFGKIAMQMRKNFVCNVCSAREKNHKIPLSWRLFA